jgi:pyrimidine-nucleoside phosphorylase
MRPVEIIIKKRDRGELTHEEIEFFVRGFANGEIPDYQVSAWAMAVLLNGMTNRETTDLTMAMAHSGDILDLTGTVRIAVDKHSTGGVGDKTTLVVAPMVAACGLPVGKMSGRGLGFSGGTLDKLESIPGYRTDLTQQEFLDQLGKQGIVLTGQSADLAPADGKLYALRDVTGTVPCIPLIASSVMSKKIAAGAQAIVLDVKTGTGAFMENLDQARELAHLMVSIGELSGRKVVALISDMNQPLGSAVGNSLELIESVETLRGGGPADFREHCMVVSSHMLVLGEQAATLEEGRKQAEQALNSGAAWEKFRDLIHAQGGDLAYVDDPNRFPKAPMIQSVAAPQSGYLANVDAREIGETSVDLGAGRVRKGEPIDHAVGIMLYHKVGDFVQAGQPLFAIHANDPARLESARERLLKAHSWSQKAVDPLPLFYDVIKN